MKQPKKSSSLILAVLPTSSGVETLLNNLSEADFDLNSVSVLLADANLRNKIHDDVGPFKGVAPNALAPRLVQRGLTQQDAQSYLDSINRGQALVAMTAPAASVSAALEMFKDYSPALLKVVPTP